MIETIIALGLLTVGISGGLSLAIFALGASDYSLSQIVATDLAREGAEVIRNMRDTNWHNDSLVDCSSRMGEGQECYLDWDDQSYDIDGSESGQDLIVSFSPLFDQWTIMPVLWQSMTRLYLRVDGIYTHLPFFGDDWKFSRKIIITRDTAAPFSSQNPRLRIESVVWWRGKNCQATDNPNNTNCKVIVEDYLTNWRNY